MKSHHDTGTGRRVLYATLIAITCVFTDLGYGQDQVKLTSLTIDDDGKVNIEIDGPAGEYIVECSLDLKPDSWTQLTRLFGDGSTKDFVDPYDLDIDSKFYSILAVPAADEFHLTGEYAAALETALSYSDLQSTFGLNFPEGEAIIPAGDDLSFSTRKARIYAATIAALSKLAKDLHESFPLASRPSLAEIVAALIEDMEDGNLDGDKNGAAVQIGTTGTFLPAYTEQDFLNALNDVKATIPGLYNVYFTGSDAGAAAGPESGTFTPSTPAIWGDFYWGSSDWQ
jgi:hypothetical protein